MVAVSHLAVVGKRAMSLRNAMAKSRSPAMKPGTTQEDLKNPVWTFGDLPAMSIPFGVVKATCWN
jgi:hypothetical protein